MKSFVVAGMMSVALAGNAISQGAPAVTPEMKAMEAKVLSRVGPQTRAWVKQEAARQRTSSTFSGTLDAQALATYPDASKLNTADVDALTFLVMMETSKSANDDLKSVAAAVKTTNEAKAAARESKTQEMGQMQSMRLQMATDRRSKMMTTLSNMMKKMSATDSTLIQNLK